MGLDFLLPLAITFSCQCPWFLFSVFPRSVLTEHYVQSVLCYPSLIPSCMTMFFLHCFLLFLFYSLTAVPDECAKNNEQTCIYGETGYMGHSRFLQGSTLGFQEMRTGRVREIVTHLFLGHQWYFPEIIFLRILHIHTYLFLRTRFFSMWFKIKYILPQELKVQSKGILQCCVEHRLQKRVENQF